MPEAHTEVAEVLLDDALNRPLDYKIPSMWLGSLKVGMRVLVPVRRSLRQGTVVALKSQSAFASLQEIKECLLENKQLPDALFALAKWLSAYYCTPLQRVLKSFLPSAVRGSAKPKVQQWIKPKLSLPELSLLCQQLRRSAPEQAHVIEAVLAEPSGILLSALLAKTGVGRAPLQALLKKNALLSQSVPVDRSELLHHAQYLPTQPKTLNPEQQQTLEKIQSSLDRSEFAVRLIHGVTGSGKTEVYLQAIQHAICQGKGVIFLVPEIALTSQIVEKLKGRFQEKIAVLHSRLSPGQRFDAWHQMHQGTIRIVLGARSALFSPITSLGLIIVDEEHESSYKQSDDSPPYHARDVAIMRAKLEQATILLGSATPSLESYHNALSGKYELSTLSQRADSASLPLVTVVDMKEEKQKHKGFTLFSSVLIDKMKERLALGEQILLFLNRRGYHTTQQCSACAECLRCVRCDTNLTFHRGHNLLACHLCDFTLSPPPRQCPSCHKENTFKFKGVGTEMVERSLHALLPEARTLRMDADTTTHKGSHEILWKQFRSGKADVLIGTQMIAKGLHFPQVTLVAILNADGALQIPDFRASEHTFQLLTQVAGRSGRGALRGEVVLQTQLPEHPLIQLAKTQDYTTFFTQEIEVRKLFGYPPFTHLVKLVFQGSDAIKTEQEALSTHAALVRCLPSCCELLPVIPCGHAKINGRFRFQFLIKTQKIAPLLAHLRPYLATHPRILVDVDPLSTFF